MSKNNRLIAVSLMVALLWGTSVSAGATDAWQPDRQKIADTGFIHDPSIGNLLLYVDEEGNEGGSVVVAKSPTTQKQILCEDIGPSLDCDFGDKVDIGSQAVLPVCGDELSNCIESLEVANESGVFQESSYLMTPNGPRFKGNPSLGVPDATSPSVFSSSVAHSEGNEYTVKALLRFWYHWGPSGKQELGVDEMSVRIHATKTVSRPGAIPSQVNVEPQGSQDGRGISVNEVASSDCIVTDTDICVKPVDFAPSTSFRLTMIVSNQLVGWFRGRMQSPDISIEDLGQTYSRLVISGKPVEVPRFFSSYSLQGGDPEIPKAPSGAGLQLYRASSPQAIEVVNLMREKVNDTAAGISTVWSMNSISQTGALGPDSWRCFQSNSKVLGIVTTNSLAYTGEVPNFNSGYLSYKVAGLHYAPNGKDLNLGTYDLVMRSETARCLYGFTKAPVSATVQVVGDQGAENIATTIVSEKDGWLKLAAYGFTFSEKEIKVKLTQPYSKTLTKFAGSARTLTSKQKAEIKSTVAKAKNNPKFICTGTYVSPSSKSTALARARAACNYAKSLDKNHSYFAQAKQTSAKSYDSKVMITSK